MRRKTTAALGGVLAMVASAAYAYPQHSLWKATQTDGEYANVSVLNVTNSASHQSAMANATLTNRRASKWQSEDRKKALEILGKKQYDLLVVPFQVTDHAYALDPIARSLMTLSLAKRISRATELSVADPVLVARALGSTARTFDELDIQKVSTALGVSHIIVGETHQDRNGAWSLTVVKRSTAAGEDADKGDLPTFEKTNIPLSGAEPAYFSFLNIRDSIVRKLLPSARIDSNAHEPQQQLPEELADLVAAEKYPTIQLLQLLAVLHPERNIDRARDSLLERSLVLTENLNPADAEVKLLKARALLLLGRRQAALSLLDGKVSADGQALKDYAMSNHTPVEQLPESSSLSALMINILQQRLGTSYGVEPDLVRLGLLMDRFKPLAELISIAYQENNVWRNLSNESIKQALDRIYPNTRFSTEAIYARQLVTPVNTIEYEITGAILEQLNTTGGYTSIPSPMGMGIQSQDYNDLVRSMTVNNVIESVYHAFNTQDKSENGYRLVNTFQPLLKDQPEFTLTSALAILDFSQKQGTAKVSLRNTALELARDGLAWSGRLDNWNRWLRHIGNDFLPELGSLDFVARAKMRFETDMPSKITGLQRNDDSLLKDGCAHNNVYSFLCFKSNYNDLLSMGNADTRISALMSDFQFRFKGHPERLDLLANYLVSKGEISKATTIFEDAVSSNSRNWLAYSNLGFSFLEKSLYSEARDIAMQYPGFIQRGLTDSVTLSNRAYGFGNRLYWAGAYQEAKPFYEISADLNTGSNASLASAIRLAIIEEDYEQAAQGTLNRARRYQSGFAIRDLAGLAIVTGNVDWAWNMIDSQQESLKKPEVWIGALMAQRALGKDNQEILNWGLSRVRGDNDHETMTLALRLLFLSATLDRDITKLLSVRLVESDKRPSIILPSVNDHIAIRNTLKPDYYFGQIEHALKSGSILKSRMVYGAEALQALYIKDYASAFDLLDEASNIYPLAEFLPYYALVAAKTGETDRIKRYIRNFELQQSGKSFHNIGQSDYAFDVFLAKAFLYSTSGDHKQALASLAAANHQTKHTESRLLPTRYQLLETARLIYLDTSEDEYRIFASKLAKDLSVIEPYQAYTHSFVAMLSKNREERVDALSKVIVLDPKSRSLAASEASELSEAKKLVESGYPRTFAQGAGI